MAIEKFIGSGDIERKYLGLAIDVSDDGGQPEYLVAGYKITDSALEFNGEEETIIDIHGDTYTTIKNFSPKQSFEPHSLTTVGEHGKIGEKLMQYFMDGDMSKFTQFKCVLIFGFYGKNSQGLYRALLYDGCTINPQSLGGDAFVDMPFEVSLGGSRTKGYATGLKNIIEFTEEIEG